MRAVEPGTEYALPTQASCWWASLTHAPTDKGVKSDRTGTKEPYSYDKDDDFTEGQEGILSSYLGNLLAVALDHGSEAQIRTYAEELATIRIDYGTLEATDFSTPLVARLRNDEQKARHIEDLIDLAEKTTLQRFGNV